MQHGPEPTTMERLRQTYAEAKATRENLVTLVMHDERTSEDIAAPLVPGNWQDLAGRPGVRFFPVPNPNGEPGLFAAFCCIAPGSAGRDGSTGHSQLIALLAGELDCDGLHYQHGQTLYLSPGQPSDWQVGEKGYLSAILFNGPPPNDDKQPAGCSVTPDLL